MRVCGAFMDAPLLACSNYTLLPTGQNIGHRTQESDLNLADSSTFCQENVQSLIYSITHFNIDIGSKD
jgi:hypothetical protein